MPILDSYNSQGHDAPKGTQTSTRKQTSTPTSPFGPSVKPLGGQQQQGPVAPGTLTPRGTPYSSFKPTPEYGNMGAWGPTSARDLDFDQMVAIKKAGIPDDQAKAFLASGLAPEVWAGLGPAGQQMASQWGTNLGNSRDIIAQQQSAYDAQLNQQQATNSYIDEFGALQNFQQDNLLSQYTQGMGMAQGRYDMNLGHMETNLFNDLGIMGQQRYRAVDLGRADNNAALLHNANMRGVLDTRRGLIGQDFTRQQGFLNDQIGFLNDRQDLAYDQFQSDDAYKAQQAQDLMAQYGFAGEQFGQQQQELFANRGTQQRAAASDAAARGAFGSAGFGDNVQDIYGQYERGMDANTLQLDRTNEALDVRDREIGKGREDLRFGYEGQQIGFAERARDINNAHDVNRIGTEGEYNTLTGQYSANDKERSQLQNVDKGLSSLAKEYGLREQDMKNQFNQAVDKMGLDLLDTERQLEQMLNSGNAALQAQGMQFMQQMMALQ